MLISDNIAHNASMLERLGIKGCPWGTPDDVREIAPGIYAVATPSHGGYFVSPALNILMPHYFRDVSFNRQGLAGWYEEDCDFAFVALVFPGAFPARAQADARRCCEAFGHRKAALAKWDAR